MDVADHVEIEGQVGSVLVGEATVYRANGPRNGFAVEGNSQVKGGVGLTLVDGLVMRSWSLNLRHCTCYFEL